MLKICEVLKICRAYHAIELSACTLQGELAFGARQSLPCNRSEILHHSGLISNLAPGRAYHAIEQFGARQGLPCNRIECLHPSGFLSNLAPGRAYHAIDLKSCTIQG